MDFWLSELKASGLIGCRGSPCPWWWPYPMREEEAWWNIEFLKYLLALAIDCHAAGGKKTLQPNKSFNLCIEPANQIWPKLSGKTCCWGRKSPPPGLEIRSEFSSVCDSFSFPVTEGDLKRASVVTWPAGGRAWFTSWIRLLNVSLINLSSLNGLIFSCSGSQVVECQDQLFFSLIMKIVTQTYYAKLYMLTYFVMLLNCKNNWIYKHYLQ